MVERKQFELDCPCCKSRLLIDVRTETILRSTRPEERDETGRPVVRGESWDEANTRVAGRIEGAADKFEAGLAKEKGRSKDLDDLFRKANEKLKDKGEDDG